MVYYENQLSPIFAKTRSLDIPGSHSKPFNIMNTIQYSLIGVLVYVIGPVLAQAYTLNTTLLIYSLIS